MPCRAQVAPNQYDTVLYSTVHPILRKSRAPLAFWDIYLYYLRWRVDSYEGIEILLVTFPANEKANRTRETKTIQYASARS